ncbi:D-alanyl-D-alanine endopeptidase [Massilia horti]|uniref:D-alanyl-D-alanine endopeptidase n=1 Tax=Massilia horti TaxID=2562153 RepID=A0A4Y9SYG3_9BURK|nr:D-alanyl-D-alanine endopeptidase [Massilia horti]TFW30484.1 D-alanyl-D-alanine endopeptidase [Massilia horti]TFW30597.1 D-alanyl-D-alanine endopeptidase [Massilia horti]
MYKLAVAAIFTLLFVYEPAFATGASTGESAGAGRPARHTVKKARVKRKDLAQAIADENRERMVRRIEMVHGKRKVVYHRVRRAAPEVFSRSAGDLAGLGLTQDPLALKSNVAFVLDQGSSEVLFEKNANVALPIASITKLMTGLVVVQANQDMDEVLTITDADVDRLKFTGSRLRVGARMTRRDLLHIALMSSENRAAAALGRNYPGGITAFVQAMNDKARELGMDDTRYVDSSGLSSENVSSARDLAKLVAVAHQEALLREFTTDPNSVVAASGKPMRFNNTNYLVAQPDWNIGLQKTGFINEAGRCLVMQAMIHGRNVIMVFLDSKGKMSRTADAGRMRRWLEALNPANLVEPAADAATAAVSAVTGSSAAHAAEPVPAVATEAPAAH